MVEPCTRVNPHQRKSVWDFAVRGQLGSEAISREELVTVIVLYDLSHCFQRHGVGIHLVGAHVVQRGGLGWVTWDKRPQNTHMIQHTELNTNSARKRDLLICSTSHINYVFFLKDPCSPLEAVKSTATVKLSWVLYNRNVRQLNNINKPNHNPPI